YYGVSPQLNRVFLSILKLENQQYPAENISHVLNIINSDTIIARNNPQDHHVIACSLFRSTLLFVY
ncbi:hypothetical protein MOC18_08115, partial [Bacillus spizizenii]|nr:hypothetical protein [Bacillus spizizenii]